MPRISRVARLMTRNSAPALVRVTLLREVWCTVIASQGRRQENTTAWEYLLGRGCCSAGCGSCVRRFIFFLCVIFLVWLFSFLSLCHFTLYIILLSFFSFLFVRLPLFCFVFVIFSFAFFLWFLFCVIFLLFYFVLFSSYIPFSSLHFIHNIIFPCTFLISHFLSYAPFSFTLSILLVFFTAIFYPLLRISLHKLDTIRGKIISHVSSESIYKRSCLVYPNW